MSLRAKKKFEIKQNNFELIIFTIEATDVDIIEGFVFSG
jgi:hypothetical protein